MIYTPFDELASLFNGYLVFFAGILGFGVTLMFSKKQRWARLAWLFKMLVRLFGAFIAALIIALILEIIATFPGLFGPLFAGVILLLMALGILHSFLALF